METILFQHIPKNIGDLDIHVDTMKLAPFQGERCSVFNAQSGIFGPLVIKTAFKRGVIDEIGRNEIRQNKEGFLCIPEQFRPDILAADNEDTFLIMPNVGQPLRDLLWINRHVPEQSGRIVDDFITNLLLLQNSTKKKSPEAVDIFITDVQNTGLFFLQGTIFPMIIKDGFTRITNQLRRNNDGIASFSTMDLTQGNLLIDTHKSPQTLKVIDPKKPRFVQGESTFLGVFEVDLGMFFTTVSLNAPETIQTLHLESRIKRVCETLRTDTRFGNLSFNLGKLFGCILIASFPNTVKRVETYLHSVGSECNESTRTLVRTEQERHVRKAIEILLESEVLLS